MSADSLHVTAILIGTKPPAEHLAQLTANPFFRTHSTKERLRLSISVAGPLKDAGTTSFE